MLDARFIDSSKEIKELLNAFIVRYESFTDEQQTATKKWLDALVALQQSPPVSAFSPKIILRTVFIEDPEEGELLPWSFPAGLLVGAIRAMEQQIKYIISVDDKLDWNV
jgi:hypothetical protein